MEIKVKGERATLIALNYTLMHRHGVSNIRIEQSQERFVLVFDWENDLISKSHLDMFMDGFKNGFEYNS